MTPPFRLENLLRLRRQERDRASKESADAQLAIARLDEKLNEIDLQNRAMDALRKESSAGNIDLGQILDAQRYQLVLAAQASHIARDRALLVQELQRRQAQLLRCQQAVKAIEKLKENHHRSAEELFRRREQSQLDEWSQTQSGSSVRAMP
jgi:flagellar export protein FliJ